MRELQSAIAQLKEQLKDEQIRECALKSEIEILKAELVEKSKLENQIKELKEKVCQNIAAKEVRLSFLS